MHIEGLYRNAKGYWIFQPSSKGLPRGTPRPKSIFLGTKDEQEALAKLVEVRGMDFTANATGLAAMRAGYLAERERGQHYRPITLEQVRHTLKVMEDYFGPHRSPIRISKADALDWFADLLRDGTRTLSTAHRYIRYARAFFSWMVERDIIPTNPFAKLKLPSPSQTRRDVFCTAEEVERLLKASAREDLTFILHCGFFLGLRIREIVEARWEWFSLIDGSGYCVVRNSGFFETKTRKERTIPFHSRFTAYFTELRKGKPGAAGYILHPECGPTRDKHLRWNPRWRFARLLKDANLEWVTFHTMRHTFGSLHAMAGTSDLKIRRWLGITAETFERHYAGLRLTDADTERIYRLGPVAGAQQQQGNEAPENDDGDDQYQTS